MMIRLCALAFLAAITSSQSPPATECWALTNLMGQVALAADSQFHADKLSNPMVLCFSKENGSVSGDDTRFVRFGTSTLAGATVNEGLELVEVYQIDRTRNKVLFTKSRIGTDTVVPGGPDLVEAFVGSAVLTRQ
jgi:hypothetical protein